MRKLVLQLLILSSTLCSFAFTNKKNLQTEPLFQLSAGRVYSNIDLIRYTNTKTFRGTHLRLVTHLKGAFSLSTEYSTFPVHASPSAWDDIHTRKFDINPQISFSTENKLTTIFVFAGANRHEWKGRRTGYTDIDQLGKGLAEGTYVEVNRWGVNFGCGFAQTLYENIGLFADYRFCFSKSNDFEKVRITDVMTTIGINLSIPYPQKSNRKKSFGIGNKIYKWTKKGAK